MFRLHHVTPAWYQTNQSFSTQSTEGSPLLTRFIITLEGITDNDYVYALLHGKGVNSVRSMSR